MKLKFIITGLFVFGLMFAGTSVNAVGTSSSDLTYSKDTSTLQYTQTLRRGVKNTNVFALQKRLQEMGYYKKALDSDYGSGTHAAVKAYQRSKGLVADGIAGPNTFAKILGVSSASLVASNPYVKPYSTKTIVKPNICTKEYVPVCGKIFSPHMGEPPFLKTFSNKCLLEQAGEQVSFLYKGKCKTTKPIDISPIDSDFDIPRVATLSPFNVVNESAHGKGIIRDMGDADEVKTFFVVGTPIYYNYVQNIANLRNSFDDIPTEEGALRKILVSESVDDEGAFSKEIYFKKGIQYWVNACLEFEDDNGNEHITCGGAKEFVISDEDPITEQCLEIRPNSSNSPVVISGISRQVAEFTLENICKKELLIEDIDFNVISSYGKPQFDDIRVNIGNYEFDDTIDEMEESYNPWNGGKELSFVASSENNPYKLDAGEEVDLVVMADVLGSYSPWNGSALKSTAFAVSLDDVDYRYDGQGFGWNQRPVWDNLIVVHYAN